MYEVMFYTVQSSFLLKKKAKHLFCLSCKINFENSMQITNVFQNENDEKLYKERYVVTHIFIFLSKESWLAWQKIR